MRNYHLQALFNETIILATSFNILSFNHIFREINNEAYALCLRKDYTSLGELVHVGVKDGVGFEFQHDFFI